MIERAILSNALALPTPALLTPAGFTRAAHLLRTTWPERRWSEATLQVYRRLIQHLPDRIVLQATARCLALRTFAPQPAELLAEAHEVLAESGEGPPGPDEAWIQVLRALHNDRTDDVHPLALAALEQVGGERIVGYAGYEQVPHYQRAFTRVYTTLARRHYLGLAGLAAQLPPGSNDLDDEPAELTYAPDPI